MRTPKERTTTTALQQLQAAAEKRATAEELAKLNDRTGAFWERREANALEQQAQATLTLTEPVRLGVGAEAELCLAVAFVHLGAAERPFFNWRVGCIRRAD